MQPAAVLRRDRGGRELVNRFRVSYAAQVAAVSAAGLVSRLVFLGHQPLWRDEAFTAVVVTRPLGPMLDAVRADSAPPLAYLLEHAVAMVSTAPAALRLVPALAGAAAVPLVAALGRRIAGDRGGLASAALAVVAPALYLSSRDARMYALATTLVIASTLLLWRALEQPSLRRWAAYAAAVALSLSTDYFAVLAVAAQLIAVVIVVRASPRRALAAAGAAGLGLLTLAPWLLVARAQFGHAGGAFWVPQLGIASVSGALVQFFSGMPVDPSVNLKLLLQTFQGLAVAAGIVIAGVLIARRGRLSAQQRRAALFCATCALGAIAMLLLLSVWRPLVDGRYASVLWGPLFPVLGAGLSLVTARRLIALGLVATAGASIALTVVQTHPDTPAAIAAIEAHLGSHDLVDAYPSQYLLVLYYADAGVASHTRVVQPGVDWFWGTAAYPPGAIVPAVPETTIANRGTIYYLADADDPPAKLPPAYRATGTQCWTDACVTTYAPVP